MIKELDSVVLVRDMPEYGLKRGDVGTVVHVYGQAEGFEVEFVSGEGTTVAVVTLGREDVRPMQSREILHVRPLASV